MGRREERAAVLEVLDSGWLTTGPGRPPSSRRSPSTSAPGTRSPSHSATGALRLAFEGLGVGAGDEVIVPTYTFAASAEMVLYRGARPVLVDVDRDTRTQTRRGRGGDHRPHAGRRGRPRRGPAGRPAGDPGRRRRPAGRRGRRARIPVAGRRVRRPLRRHDRPGRRLQLLRDQDDLDRRGRDARRPTTTRWRIGRGRCASTGSAATPGSATPPAARGTTRSRPRASRTTCPTSPRRSASSSSTRAAALQAARAVIAARYREALADLEREGASSSRRRRPATSTRGTCSSSSWSRGAAGDDVDPTSRASRSCPPALRALASGGRGPSTPCGRGHRDERPLHPAPPPSAVSTDGLPPRAVPGRRGRLRRRHQPADLARHDRCAGRPRRRRGGDRRLTPPPTASACKRADGDESLDVGALGSVPGRPKPVASAAGASSSRHPPRPSITSSIGGVGHVEEERHCSHGLDSIEEGLRFDPESELPQHPRLDTE